MISPSIDDIQVTIFLSPDALQFLDDVHIEIPAERKAEAETTLHKEVFLALMRYSTIVRFSNWGYDNAPL